MSETYVDGIRVPFLPARGVEGLREKEPFNAPEGSSFEELLKRELDQLKFSKHAQERLESREIHLSESDLAYLFQAVEMAEKKGATETLVLLPARFQSSGKDLGFIVNVKNKTVVTAIDEEHLKENVFTNIDSAVVVG